MNNVTTVVAISPFNSYFCVENMTKLFTWCRDTYDNFIIFIMDYASTHNLIAQGYSEIQAAKRTRKHDKNLYNKVMQSLYNCYPDKNECKERILLLSALLHDKKYMEKLEYYTNIFDTNEKFRLECLNTTRSFSEQNINVGINFSNLSVKYLLYELPIWFELPYILDCDGVRIVYKGLTERWKILIYNYGYLSENIVFVEKDVTLCDIE